MDSTKFLSVLFIVMFLIALVWHPLWALVSYPIIGGILWVIGYIVKEPLGPIVCIGWLPRLAKNLYTRV